MKKMHYYVDSRELFSFPFVYYNLAQQASAPALAVDLDRVINRTIQYVRNE